MRDKTFKQPKAEPWIIIQQIIDLAYRVICEHSGECEIEDLPNEMQCIADATGQANEQPKAEPWHACEHCKQFSGSVKILDLGSYAVGMAKSWEDAVAICDTHNAAIEKAHQQGCDE